MNTPKISLCIIAGNVERYIARFLDCFSPIVDEIILVRACGSQPPDKTATIAKEKGAKVLHYINQDDWPHVDNFAAARRVSFDAAENEWILWADTDDIISEDGAQALKQSLAEHHENADALAFIYAVPEDGLRVWKERLVRKSAVSWRYRVHEELYFTIENPRVIKIDGPEFVHMPSGTRKPNDERNLRLLNAMVADGTITIGHRFHRVNTLRALGKMDEFLAEATSLVKEPELNTPERYELLMALAETCPDSSQQGQIYLQALALDPSRREAYGELAIFCARHMMSKQMLAWTTAMRALPRPRGYLWNHKAMYYGHAGERLHAMALRLNGRRETADAVQLNHFKKHGAMISLIHATRGRAKMALQTQHRWLSRAENPDAIEHIFALDSDDEQMLPLAANLSVVVEPGGGCVRAWNAAAAMSSGKVIVQLSDDFDCPMHWDRLILERFGDLTRPAVLDISDGYRKDNLICTAILTRARIEQQGYFLHPGFLSMYSDNWLSHCAHRDGIVIPAKDLVFEHLHPAAGKGQWDKTYLQSNDPERYAQGEALYTQLVESGNPF